MTEFEKKYIKHCYTCEHYNTFCACCDKGFETNGNDCCDIFEWTHTISDKEKENK